MVLVVIGIHIFPTCVNLHAMFKLIVLYFYVPLDGLQCCFNVLYGGDLPSGVSNVAPSDVSGGVSNDVSSDVSDSASNDVSSDVSGGVSNVASSDVSGASSNDVSNDVSDAASNGVSCVVSGAVYNGTTRGASSGVNISITCVGVYIIAEFVTESPRVDGTLTTVAYESEIAQFVDILG